MKKNNKKGMAMIAALMAAFILLALVSTLCLLATSSTRRANYAKKATIALHLAEAGVADALYRMNYPHLGVDGDYPFDSSSIPAFSGATSNATATTISGTLEGGSYEVTFTDNVSSDTDTDRITSAGTYKGIKRTLSVFVRGDNDSATPAGRQDSRQGVAEAFNKHTVYANAATITAAVANNAITGNISATATGGIADGRGAPTNCSKTTIPDIQFAVPAPTAPADVTLPTFTGPVDQTYTDPGPPYPTTYDPDAGGPWPEANVTAGPVFTFDATDTIPFGSLTQVQGNVIFMGNAQVLGHFQATGSIDISSASVDIQNSLKAMGGHLNINSDLNIQVNGDLCASGNITIVNQTIPVSGSVIAQGNITLNGGTFGGVRTSGASITLQTNLCIIGPSGNIEAPILIKNLAPLESATVNINTPTTVNVNSNQNAAIIAYSSANEASGTEAKIDLTAQLTVNLATINQPTLIAYSENENAVIDIDIGIGNPLGGLIYAGSGDATATDNATITLTTGDITGVLVAGGTDAVVANRADGIVNINGGTLEWDSTPYKSSNYPLYGHSSGPTHIRLSGGRRVYLPVLGSWRQK